MPFFHVLPSPQNFLQITHDFCLTTLFYPFITPAHFFVETFMPACRYIIEKHEKQCCFDFGTNIVLPDEPNVRLKVLRSAKTFRTVVSIYVRLDPGLSLLFEE